MKETTQLRAYKKDGNTYRLVEIKISQSNDRTKLKYSYRVEKKDVFTFGGWKKLYESEIESEGVIYLNNLIGELT